jgi:hypothetical protein
MGREFFPLKNQKLPKRTINDTFAGQAKTVAEYGWSYHFSTLYSSGY